LESGDISRDEYCELNRNKKVFLESDVKDYLVHIEGKEMNLENLTRKYGNLVDNALRADVIVTMNIEKTKLNIKELVDIYNFLIEDDEPNNWRKKLPSKREFIDIMKLCFEE
jgi:hypothetical protein